MNENWLIVLPEMVFPANSGDRTLTYYFLEALKEQGIGMQLICFHKADYEASDYQRLQDYAEKLWMVRRHYHPGFLFDRSLPFQNLTRHVSTALAAQVAECARQRPISLVFCHSLYTLHVGHQLAELLGKPLVLRSNNVESLYYQGLWRSAVSFLPKIYYKKEAERFQQLENEVFGRGRFPKLKAVFDLSVEDRIAHEKKATSQGSLMIKHLPPFLPQRMLDLPGAVVRPAVVGTKANRLFYVGSLNVPNNVEGLLRFLEQVWPQVLQSKPNVSFQIAGSRPSERLKKQLSGYSNITFYESPPSLAPFFQEADLFVNPIYQGSGVNIKNIDALLHRMPLITTATGARGLHWEPGTHLAVAKDDDDFARLILHFLERPQEAERLAIQGNEFVKKELASTVCINAIRQAGSN